MYSEVSGEAGKVSIHASSREDATIEMPVYLCDLRFNPRVLAGGRDPLIKLAILTTMVSIHASSREDATAIVFNIS